MKRLFRSQAWLYLHFKEEIMIYFTLILCIAMPSLAYVLGKRYDFKAARYPKTHTTEKTIQAPTYQVPQVQEIDRDQEEVPENPVNKFIERFNKDFLGIEEEEAVNGK